MNQNLLNGTQLNDRFLCFDGDSVFKPDSIKNLILADLGIPIIVDEITKEIIQLNNNKSKKEKILLKSINRELDYSWNIPEEYKNININTYVKIKFERNSFNETEKINRLKRTALELALYRRHNLIEFLKVLIYIIDIFEINNIIWGVGRGSSVSSFVLYLLGVHDIDSYRYNLDITEFLRE